MDDVEYIARLNNIMLNCFVVIGKELELNVFTAERTTDQVYNSYWEEGLGRYTMTVSIDSIECSAFIVIQDATLHAVHAQVVSADPQLTDFGDRLVSLIKNINYQPLKFYISEKEQS